MLSDGRHVGQWESDSDDSCSGRRPDHDADERKLRILNASKDASADASQESLPISRMRHLHTDGKHVHEIPNALTQLRRLPPVVGHANDDFLLPTVAAENGTPQPKHHLEQRAIQGARQLLKASHKVRTELELDLTAVCGTPDGGSRIVGRQLKDRQLSMAELSCPIRLLVFEYARLYKPLLPQREIHVLEGGLRLRRRTANAPFIEIAEVLQEWFHGHPVEGNVVHHKVEHVQKKITAAAKVIPVKYEEELEDFVIEVDILTVCKQEGLIGLVGAHLWKGECERSPVGAGGVPLFVA